jgi:hypothetical protein
MAGESMRLELVSIETSTYPLDGLFYRPEGGADKGAILVISALCRELCPR